VSNQKRDFVGKRSFARADTARADRKQLVGLLPERRLVEGTQIVAAPGETAMLGHVTSSYDSVALGRPFALALVRAGRGLIGETVYCDGVAAEVVAPALYDPEGARRDGRPA
jgi:sarcosine oxidase, subunit alpha